MTKRFCLLLIFGFLAVAAVAQSGNAWFTASSGGSATVVSGGRPGVVIGKPYSAEQVSEHVQTLADGTRITDAAQRTLMYRDSEGRTRTERLFTPPPGVVMDAGITFIQISDPVAGVRYSLNERDHTAQKTPYGPVVRSRVPVPNGVVASTAGNSTSGQNGAAAAGSSASASSAPHQEIVNEPLGMESIGGVMAQGKRTTITYPVGFIGNDRPVVVVTETWTSPDLKLVVLSKTSDPRNGESTTRMENVSQTEPDPGLFQLPSEYTVVELQPAAAGGVVNK